MTIDSDIDGERCDDETQSVLHGMTHGNDSHNFLHFSNLNIYLGAESKINSLCVFQSPRIDNL